MSRRISNGSAWAWGRVLIGLEILTLCCAARAADRANAPKPAAVDAEQYTAFMENEAFDLEQFHI